MIFKSPEKHLTDQEFFSYIKFFDLVIEKKALDNGLDTFSLNDLGIGSDEKGYIFNRIEMSAQLLELSVAIEKGYKFAKEVADAKAEAEKKPKKEQGKLLKIIEEVEKGGPVSLEDIAVVSWIWYEIYDHIRFTPAMYEVPEEIEKIFRMELDKYLDNLINDKLAINKKNYYKFEAQKKALILLIEEGDKISLYGNNFLINEKTDAHCISHKMPDFCIIQTVYALQKLGYLKVVDVWGSSKYKDTGGGDTSYWVNVNLILEDVFVDEINSSFKKKNPTKLLEEFDEKHGLLKFAGQEIELAKKGKETDAVLLLKTLLKAEGTEWKHNDEILEDWGYNDEDQKKVPKNKVYFAGLKVNTAVALKTQIEDLIECNTTKARINPKYRKLTDS